MNPYVFSLPTNHVINDFVFVADQTIADLPNAVPQIMHPGSERGGFAIITAFLRTRTVMVFGLSANVSDGDTITINNVTYTFVTTITGSQQILIGVDESATIANLVAQINADTAILQATATDLGSGSAQIDGTSAATPILVTAVTTGDVHTIFYVNGDTTATVQLITYNARYQRYCYNSTIDLTGNGCVEFVAHVGTRPFGFLVTVLGADSAISLSGYIANDLVGRP